MGVIIIVILILINGFFALSEIALVTSKAINLEQFRNKGRRGATKALKLQENSEEYLSAIQVGITLVGIVMGMYSGIRIASDVQPLFESIGIDSSLARDLSLVLTVFVITYASIVIGELVPKTIALSNPEPVAVIVAPMIFILSKIFYPFVKLLSGSTNLIKSLFNIQPPFEKITETELRQLMKIASSQGVIEQEQNAIHEKVFFFSDKQAKHLMTHRNEVEWIDVTMPESEIKKFIQNAIHSKIVCSRRAVDNYVGILYLHEYFKKVVAGTDYEITSIMQEPYVVTNNTSAQKILELFRKEKIYLCIVVNQEQKIDGIITLHDILEHIVGTVPNEGEEYEPEILVHEEDTVLVNGDAPVEILTDLIEGFEIDFEKVDYSSVAGFVFFQLNKVPEVGDRVELPDYIIEVESVVDSKIDNVLVKKKKID